MLDMASLVIAIGAIAIFVLFAGMNIYIIGYNLRNSALKREGHVSLIPLVGGFSGAVGFLALAELRVWAWVPLLLDPGTALALLIGVPVIAVELWRTSTFNLMREYVAENARKRVCLRLFRNNLLVIVQDFKDAEPIEPGGAVPVQLSLTGTWIETDEGLKLTIGAEEAMLVTMTVDTSKVFHLVPDFPSSEHDYRALGGLDFRLTVPSSA